MRIEGLGISIDLPTGWEGRVFRLGDEGLPTLHAANFPLPVEDGEFGGVALATMGRGGIFVAVTEYEARLAGRGLFNTAGGPVGVLTSDLDPRALQQLRPGRFGVQRFFTEAGRPFCLFVAVQTPPSAQDLAAQATSVVSSLDLGPDGTGPRLGQEQGSRRRI